MSSSSASKHLILVDGSGFIFRAFHGIPLMLDPSGTPVNAVYGFTNMMMKIIRERTASHMAVIFDAGRKTFRNDIYPAYKAQRPPPPEELIPQFALVKEASRLLGLPTIEMAGWEADDLIASYAKAMVKAGGECTIISSDKDLMQLINDHVCMQDPIKEKLIREPEVMAKFGVDPSKMIALQALMGDSVDNVPGVPGIGPKTAAALINEYGGLEEILAAIPTMKASKRRDNLEEHQENARISYQLVQLKDDLDLPVPIENLGCCNAEEERLITWLQERGFRSILARYSKGHVSSHSAAGNSVQASQKEEEKDHSYILSPAYENYETITSLEQLKIWIKLAQETHYCALDTETDSLNALQANIVGISMAVAPGKACYIPIAHQQESLFEEQSANQLAVGDLIKAFSALFTDPAVLKIFHNAKYDFLVFHHNGFPIPTPYDDTMMISYVQAAGKHRHNMDELAQLHLNHQNISYDEITGTGRKRITFAQVPIDKATNYAAEDADVTLRLWLLLRPNMRALNVLSLYEEMERPLINVLTQMEQDGILIDPNLLRSLSQEFSQKMDIQEKEIHKMAGKEFNVASPKQLGEILFDDMDFSGGKRMKTGAWGTDSKVLQELSDKGHTIADQILGWRQLAKLKSTYTDALIEDINPQTGRVHTSFNMVGTVTGRLSSTDPNLQNIPIRSEEGGKIRAAFISAPDHVLVSADYSQIELRLLAHVANIPQLKESFINNEDIHARTASEVFNTPIKGMDPLVRRQAKAINFGIIYGISAFGLGKQLGVSAGIAKQYIDTYFARYPEIKAYMQTTQEEAKENGYVLTPFGRKCWIAGIQTAKGPQRAYAERQAINAPLQGGAADIIKSAMLDMDKAIKEHQLQAKMLLQVHDELLFEVKEEDAEKFVNLTKEIMQKTVKISIPLVVEAGIGKNWSEAH
ncbi:DNA polymerase I [Commensalibacter papalotli (ex Servin-Garciduenas et al. 2014)]|uniref:DNA polymerase I n=1 Tax=Commensalibacter papalotli (ex Servin-Garciduenas et al. 2014) TaxID=1208583 RepID=W7DUW4_9PROT|nr:DNA polymerase I [Commensalibacter papalotli (ex Servin-Garciduenas et al. 2014)]EUK18058.1 DNA polymerase I [Commensalibacter papalotli (ex Servin-Garciduenas et al. 2014)]